MYDIHTYTHTHHLHQISMKYVKNIDRDNIIIEQQKRNLCIKYAKSNENKTFYISVTSLNTYINYRQCKTVKKSQE